MALTYEGNLGIGITNPTDRLNVQVLLYSLVQQPSMITLPLVELYRQEIFCKCNWQLAQFFGNVVVNSEEQLLTAT